MKKVLKKIIVYILQLEAKLVLKKYKPKIIAITGSVGKTSTKDAIYSVFSLFYYVRKSEKSYNSEIGLPLTILGIPNGWNNPFLWLSNIFKGLWLFIYNHKYPKWLILEVGVGKPGDMKKTASWLKSDVVIITAISEIPVHIEFFNSRNHLIEEKSQLIKTLKKNGLLILNADDEALIQIKDKIKGKNKIQIKTYGFTSRADLLTSGESIFYSDNGLPKGVTFRVDEGGISLPVVIDGVFGRNHIYACLASLALVSNLKLNMLSAINALKNYNAPSGRMRLHFGINDSLIIDDTYNSSPSASVSALKTLKEIKCTGRKIALLGDMLELGKYTEEAHKNIGRLVKDSSDILIVVGARAQAFKIGAIEAGMKEKNILEFTTSKEAGEFLKTFIKKGDLILLKASQGIRMERAVEAILKDQKNKSQLLVRQEPEWLLKN